MTKALYRKLRPYKFDGGFVIFLILLGMIATAGPGHNEGGFEAIKGKGLVEAVSQAVKEADPSSLRGNYGNS